MAAPSIQLTPAERGAFGHFFALADPQSTGVVSGTSAVSFFALSNLPSPVLGTIWTLADKDNNGFLTPADFSVALRLIGHAQGGRVVVEDLAQQPGPLPTFKGIILPPHLTASAAVSTPTRSASTLIQPQLTGSTAAGSDANAIRPEDRARYTRIFASAGPQSGLLDGEKAKEIFVKSKLPFDKLGAIWNLADTKARGKLDLTDFIVGMHFIQSTMNGSLTSIPATLPAGLYEKAAGGALPPSSPVAAQNTGGSIPGGAPSSFIARQMTGQGGTSHFSSPGSPVPSQLRSPTAGLQPQRTGTMMSSLATPAAGLTGWSVSPADKAKADQFFDGLDQEQKGILEGQAAVPFFMQSGLDEATLAHVWDLSDITQSGTLTRDEFAVAMHLINLKLTGSDLPQELPTNLIPPSLRNQQLPQAVNPQETDTQRDLFSLMDDDDVGPPLIAATPSTFVKPAVPASSAAVQSRAAPAAPPAAKGAFDSAFDDDFMGSGAGSTPSAVRSVVSPTLAPAQTLSPVPTGGSASTLGATTASRSLQQPFGDPSADVANQRLALESTQKSLDTLGQSKSELSRGVAADGSAIEDLRTRLETVRMRHQTESEAVKALKERHAAQTAELKTLREESVREESELSRLRQEKDDVEQALMKDREDVREMKRLMSDKTQQKEALKAEIEKLKKDGRQQKGLLAISKKQLAQADNDVAKTQEELETVKAGHVEHDAVDAQQHAVHGEVPVTSPVVAATRDATLSPAISVRSNNPFDRLTQAGSSHAGAAVAGGTVGAVAAGVGAAALAGHGQSHEGVSQPGGGGVTSTDTDDPFGQAISRDNEAAQPAAAASTSAATAGGSTTAFDDSFGADFPTANAAGTDTSAAKSHVNQTFDDAFADLDTPNEAAPAGHTDEELASHGSFAPAGVPEPTQPAEESAAVPNVVAAPIEDLAVPTESKPVDDLPVTSAAVDDDDEGPHTRAPTADEVASGADVQQAPQEKGKAVAAVDGADDDSSDDDDEGPEDVSGYGGRRHVDSPDEMGAAKTPFGEAATQDPTIRQAAAVTDVDDRFPALDSEPQASEAPGSAAVLPPSFDRSTSSISTSGGTPAPITAVATGTTDAGHQDAFHDAQSESTPFDTAHERFSTAVDGSGGTAGGTTSGDGDAQRFISPAKTRRAPPAVPMRGATGSSTSGLAATAAVAPSAAAASALAKNPNDDFDAAFEDLGPSTSDNAAGNGFGDTTVTSLPGGFDDTFGDADGFDFVPSFSNNNIAATTNGSAAQKGSANAFDGFDSSFADAFDVPSTASKAAPPAEPNFSFDDAFGVPAEAISTGRTPPQTAAALPPAAPPRTAAAAAASNTPGSDNALPDDAGPVKQLCSMGFTRTDVIKALEKSNYRTDKALERLLAQA